MAPDRQDENQTFTNPLTGQVINQRLSGQVPPLVSRLKMRVAESPLASYAVQRLSDLGQGSSRFISRLVSHAGAALSHAGRLSGMVPGYLTGGDKRAKNSPMWQPVLDLTWFQRQQRPGQEQVYRRAVDVSPELPLSDGESPEVTTYQGGFLQEEPGSAEDIHYDYREAGYYEVSSEKATGELLPSNINDSSLPDDRATSIPPITPSIRPLTEEAAPRRDPLSLQLGIPPLKTPGLSRGRGIQKSDSSEDSTAEDRPIGGYHQSDLLYRRLDQGRLTGAQRIIPDHAMLGPAGDIDIRVTGSQITRPASPRHPREIETSGEPYRPVDRHLAATDLSGVASVVTGKDEASTITDRNMSPVLPEEEGSLPVYRAHEGITGRLKKVIDRVRQSVAPKRDESPVKQPGTPSLSGEELSPGFTERPVYQTVAEDRESIPPAPLQLSLHRVAGQETGTSPESVVSEDVIPQQDTGAISQAADIPQSKSWLMRRVETYLPRLKSLVPLDLAHGRPLRPLGRVIQKSDTGRDLPADVGRHYRSLPAESRREHMPAIPGETRAEPLDSVGYPGVESEGWPPVFDVVDRYPPEEPSREYPDSISTGDIEVDQVAPVFKPVDQPLIGSDIFSRQPGLLPGLYAKSVGDISGDISEPEEPSQFPVKKELWLPSSRPIVQRRPEMPPRFTEKESEGEGSISGEDIVSGVIEGAGYYGHREVPELALAPAGRQAETTSAAPPETRQASAEGMAEGAAPEIDDIARDVYRILRRRLIRERERALGIS
ncbi:MAG: hypothetical protein JSW16_00300 [Dehalococcoidales bacterium]|nr:MAG: hypothetical protein JSW16_00300 [Dehalococcoidales bacterium]